MVSFLLVNRSSHLYSSVLFFLLLMLLVVSLIYVAIYLVSWRGEDSLEKKAPYECGFDPSDEPRQEFKVSYYLVGILFILFDLEITYLFPWAMVGCETMEGYLSMMVFLFILIVGFAYEWKKGGMNW